MSNYSDWEFDLAGDGQDFLSMKEMFSTTNYFHIYGGVDGVADTHDFDGFSMTTFYSQGETNHNDVWKIGYELISLFNGAAILFHQHYRKASIKSLHYQNSRQPHVQPSGGTPALLLPPTGIAASDIQSALARSKSNARMDLLHLATDNWDVYCILKYLDMEPGWVNYYKLLEVVEHFAGQKSIKLGYSKTQRSNFTNPANNFAFVGFQARHGFKQQNKQNNTAAMTLDQAYDFVTDAAKTYLRQAHSVRC